MDISIIATVILSLMLLWLLGFICHEHGRIKGMHEGALRERHASHIRATKARRSNSRNQWQQ